MNRAKTHTFFYLLFFGLGLSLTTLLTTGCQTNKDTKPTTFWNGPSHLEINTPYLIRTIEKNGMDAFDEENPTVRYAAIARYPEYVGQQFKILNEEINAYVQDKVDDFADVMMTGSYNEAFSKDSFAEMDIDFITYHYTSAFASILFDGYECTPAFPRGFHYYRTMNYDALNEEFFTLQDCIIGEDEFLRLTQIVTQKIEEQHPDWNKEKIEEGTSPELPENYNLFIIRPGEFIIFFQPYQLGRKAKDSTSVSVPFSEVIIQPFILDLINYHPSFSIPDLNINSSPDTISDSTSSDDTHNTTP